MTAPLLQVPLLADAHATGARIDVSFTLERPLPPSLIPDRPELRVVRAQLGMPTDSDGGVVVADLRELFVMPTQAFERIERLQARTRNTGLSDGALEAEVALYSDAVQPSEPVMARVRLFDAATQGVAEDLFEEVSRVERTAVAAAGWSSHDAIEIFHTPGGGPEESAGVVEIFTGSTVTPPLANQLRWTPDGAPTRTVQFETYTHRKYDRRVEASDLEMEVRDIETPDADPGVTWLTLSAASDEDAGKVFWSLEVRDRDVDPEVHYYYMVYDLAAGEPLGEATALATRDYGASRDLFFRLPGSYQRADEPDPTTPTGAAGPLRRFLQPVGHSVDLGRSLARSTRDRHDVFTVRADLLPHLARMIGWSPDLTAAAEVQRRDILTAPELFGSVGSTRNIKALVNRATRWPCRVKEFVNNVFLTNAPETIRLWELWGIRNDGTQWTTPVQLTLTLDIDARPALAVDAGGDVWMFWHSDRETDGGPREIWRQRLDGVDTDPMRARAGASDDVPELVATDEDPAAVWDGAQVWLFWSSDREGQWDIWGRTFDGTGFGGDPVRLTDHASADRSPAAAFVPGAPGRLWLFWSSRRRGPADIWARSLDVVSGIWSDAERVTESPLRDDRPAACVDATGTLWLFWTRDAGGRQTIWYKQHDGTSWLDPVDSELDVAHVRDEAPAVVPWNAGVFLLWHSNHAGAWQIWGRAHDGTSWGSATRLSRSVAGSKEPAAVIDGGGDMRVVWRSQRRARRYRSRTLDLDDTTMLAPMGTFADHVHYTYDTATSNDDWYDRGAVGLYLTPDTAVTSEIEANVARLRTFVDPFRAVPVRYVWLPADGGVDEELSPANAMDEDWSDELV